MQLRPPLHLIIRYNRGALSDEQIVHLRSQAATMQKEAERLLKEADELHPLPNRGRGRPPKVETTEVPAE